jgi:hypothetical protein
MQYPFAGLCLDVGALSEELIDEVELAVRRCPLKGSQAILR